MVRKLQAPLFSNVIILKYCKPRLHISSESSHHQIAPLCIIFASTREQSLCHILGHGSGSPGRLSNVAYECYQDSAVSVAISVHSDHQSTVWLTRQRQLRSRVSLLWWTWAKWKRTEAWRKALLQWLQIWSNLLRCFEWAAIWYIQELWRGKWW